MKFIHQSGHQSFNTPYSASQHSKAKLPTRSLPEAYFTAVTRFYATYIPLNSTFWKALLCFLVISIGMESLSFNYLLDPLKVKL